jgi:spore coat protein U-like protein
MKKLFAFLAAVAAPFLIGTPAIAAGSFGPVNLDVTATVPGSCTATTSGVAFGDYVGSQLDAQGSITVNCDLDLPYSIDIDGGAGGGGTRQMSKLGAPSVKLVYELYQESGRTTVWGGDSYSTGGAVAKGGQFGLGTGELHNVFGRILAGAGTSPGDYSDTVLVTINY